MKKRLAEKVFRNIMRGIYGYRASTLDRAFRNRNASRDRDPSYWEEGYWPTIPGPGCGLYGIDRQVRKDFAAAVQIADGINFAIFSPVAEFVDIRGRSLTAEDIENLKSVIFERGS